MYRMRRTAILITGNDVERFLAAAIFISGVVVFRFVVLCSSLVLWFVELFICLFVLIVSVLSNKNVTAIIAMIIGNFIERRQLTMLFMVLIV
jgi:hypothetical protein